MPIIQHAWALPKAPPYIPDVPDWTTLKNDFESTRGSAQLRPAQGLLAAMLLQAANELALPHRAAADCLHCGAAEWILSPQETWPERFTFVQACMELRLDPTAVRAFLLGPEGKNVARTRKQGYARSASMTWRTMQAA